MSMTNEEKGDADKHGPGVEGASVNFDFFFFFAGYE